MTRHGTNSKYSQGCRCDECRTARRVYSQKLRERDGIRPKGDPVEHNGTVYASQSDMARQTGVSRKTIYLHLERYGDLSKLRVRA